MSFPRPFDRLCRTSPRAFNVALIGFCASAALCFACFLAFLHAENRLPAPPLTSTSCIDEKFLFLHNTDLTSVNFLAVGSSATWRNLDFSAVSGAWPSVRPLNAAPCYLYMDQTAYLSEFLV